ncbi:unnamed protein product [Clonostachys rosea f. rosea IK726]|uniref:Zn(2)-C6 fungal-type domain-containing protein n=2 Tax=Bionectria ochroleuca TaxID=29856 RepID=A0A0B7KQ03_BIOOC|nr:unnamed protein product [Clonostachys rosea f. rosea IK726]
MVGGRLHRSKTGCRACRRRKVRCDERKPICSACERLNLPCAYGSGPEDSGTGGASKFRVRFVNSSYSRPVAETEARAKAKEIQVAPLTTEPINDSPGALSSTASKSSPSFRSLPANDGHSSTLSQCAQVDPILVAGPITTSIAQQQSHDDGPLTLQHTASVWDTRPLPLSLLGVNAEASENSLPDDNINSQDVIPTHVSPMQGVETGRDPMPMSGFFDLNLTFDSLGEEWMSLPYEPIQSTAPAVTAATLQISEEDDNQSNSSEASGQVTIAPADHSLIQHYLNVMSQYAKLRGSADENIYTQIFSNMALFYPPLYHAIMAWTAMHLGQTKRQTYLIDVAEQRNSHAIVLLHQDRDIASHLELALVAIWFALQFDLLASPGIDSSCRHLEFAADLLDAQRRQAAAAEQSPSPLLLGRIGTRVLLWLGTFDARASWVGGTGRLLQSLELFRASYDFLEALFPDATHSETASSSHLKSSLQSNLDLDLLDNRFALLHRQVLAAPATIWSEIQSELLSLQRRLESSPIIANALDIILHNSSRVVKGKITTNVFNNLLLLSACYSLIIEFHRLFPSLGIGPLEPTDKLISGEVAATRIIRISAWVCRLRPPSPQNIWPRILFLAGIETTDLIQQDWVLRTLSEAERWGGNFTKTRALLDYVIKEQGSQGARLDYLDAMKQCTGLFIL